MTTVVKKPLEPALRLMERVHREGREMADEFPLVFLEGQSGEAIALHEGERVLSTCALLPRTFVMPQARVRFGLVGSVATDPDHRGRGFATRVLEAAEERLARAGCAFALLWADQTDFYVARGWRPIGWEIDWLLTGEIAERLPAPDGVRTATAADHAAIHELYARHPLRVDRSLEETSSLLGCPRMRVLVRQEAGAVTAYACLGRGDDLGGTIHEWGGPTDDVLRLARAHLEAELAPGADGVFLMTPPTAFELARRLAELGAGAHDGILGLAKVVDRRAAGELLATLVAPEAEVRCEEIAGGSVRLTLAARRGEGELVDDVLLGMLFSPHGVRGEIDELGRSFGFSTERLPLTPFAWGLDSI